jgi:hypothetical protein
MNKAKDLIEPKVGQMWRGEKKGGEREEGGKEGLLMSLLALIGGRLLSIPGLPESRFLFPLPKILEAECLCYDVLEC